jgi:peptidylamidoglycolate lyase
MKIIYIILALLLFLLAAYFLQPIKKGKGLDQTTAYILVKNWPMLPQHQTTGNPVGLGIDTSENIVVFHRADRQWPLVGPMPEQPIQQNTILIIHKKSGKLLSSWGSNLFVMPHGLTVDQQNNIWVTDVGLHQVFKFRHDGKLLLKLGVAKVPGPDSLHFNKPTDVAVAADGSFYVSDGYGNNRIVKFSPTGSYLFQWGRKGAKEGEFDTPHALCLDRVGNVYVADRENNRIQAFDSSGMFIQQWADDSFGSMGSVYSSENSKLFTVDDFTFLKIKHRGSDILILDTAGKVQTRFGRSGAYQGRTTWYHDLVVDSEENIYVGDILGNKIQKFRKVEVR